MTLRLFEKIQALESNSPQMGVVQVEDVIDSIRHHLSLILNTRKGSSLIDDDFGVPDFTNLVGGLEGESTTMIERSMDTMIKRYEPRLMESRVELMPGDGEILSIKFSISGYVKNSGRDTAVRLNGSVNAAGKITIL